MKKDQRQDDEAVRTAVMSLVYKASDKVRGDELGSMGEFLNHRPIGDVR